MAQPHRSRSFILGAVLAVLLAPVAIAQVAPSGVAGPYLAAQQAERRGDVATAATEYSAALARDRNNPALLERAMMHQIAAGNVPEGISMARGLEEMQPGHHLGVLAQGADRLLAGEAEAVRALFRTPDPSGGPFVAQIMDAWAAFDTGDVEAARGLLGALEVSQENGQAGQIVAAYHLGLLEAATGDDQAAVDAFARTAELTDGGTLRLARLWSGALARLGRTDEALTVINARLEGTYGDRGLSALAARIESGARPDLLVGTGTQGAAEVLFGVSGLLSRGRNRLIALSYARLAVHLNPDLAEATLLIGEILDDSEQYDLAIAALRTVPDDVPEALPARIAMAEAMTAGGDVDGAVAGLEALIVRHPQSLDARTTLGDILRRERRFAEAGDAYDGAIMLVGTPAEQHWVLYYQRGIAFERSQQWDRAEADFKQALALRPGQPLVLNYLGYSWVEQGVNLAQAEDMIEQAVEQRPDDGYIVDSLGWVLYRVGEFDRALGHLERAVELRPVDPVINDHYGDALWMVGREIEAAFQWKRALSFEPEEKDATRIRRKLDVGLDKVLDEEAAAGNPAIIGRKDGGPASTGSEQDGG